MPKMSVLVLTIKNNLAKSSKKSLVVTAPGHMQFKEFIHELERKALAEQKYVLDFYLNKHDNRIDIQYPTREMGYDEDGNQRCTFFTIRNFSIEIRKGLLPEEIKTILKLFEKEILDEPIIREAAQKYIYNGITLI